MQQDGDSSTTKQERWRRTRNEDETEQVTFIDRPENRFSLLRKRRTRQDSLEKSYATGIKENLKEDLTETAHFTIKAKGITLAQNGTLIVC